MPFGQLPRKESLRMSSSSLRTWSFDQTPTPQGATYMHPSIMCPPFSSANVAGPPIMQHQLFSQLGQVVCPAMPLDGKCQIQSACTAPSSGTSIAVTTSQIGTPVIQTCFEAYTGMPMIPALVPASVSAPNTASFQPCNVMQPVAGQQPAVYERVKLPTFSDGSSKHDGRGSCAPCAWYWKAKGCDSGAACNYCHLCSEGELKRRKKVKVAGLRAAAAHAKSAH